MPEQQIDHKAVALRALEVAAKELQEADPSDALIRQLFDCSFVALYGVG